MLIAWNPKQQNIMLFNLMFVFKLYYTLYLYINITQIIIRLI